MFLLALFFSYFLCLLSFEGQKSIIYLVMMLVSMLPILSFGFLFGFLILFV